MEWFIFWIGVNGLIGYAIGKPKNNTSDAILVSVLLGPLGWLLAALSRGNLRKCPFCAEGVNPEAVVCKHCGRDLPDWRAQLAEERAIAKKRSRRTDKGFVIAIAAVILVLLAGLSWDRLMSRPGQNGRVSSTPIPRDDFADERQTHYVRIIHPVITRDVQLSPGAVVLVTARNSKMARIRTAAGEAEIPISATDLAK